MRGVLIKCRNVRERDVVINDYDPRGRDCLDGAMKGCDHCFARRGHE